MRKKLSVLMSIVMCVTVIFSFTACGNGDDAPDPAPNGEVEAPVPDPDPANDGNDEVEVDEDRTLVIGFANYSLDNPYCATMAEGAAERAAELGIELNVVDNQQDATHQVGALENFITMGVDGILILPVSNVAIEHVVEEAVAAGIPVIANSQQVDAANMFVAADDFEMGYNLGIATAEWLNTYNDGEGSVAYLNAPHIPHTIPREEGFLQAIETYAPNAEVVMQVPGGDAETALASAEAIIQAHPDIAAIAAYNDAAGIVAAHAAEAAGIDPARIFVGGVDATPEALELIREGGHFKATVDNIPFDNGRLLIDFIVRLIDGEEMEFNYAISTRIVNASNIHEY